MKAVVEIKGGFEIKFFNMLLLIISKLKVIGLL